MKTQRLKYKEVLLIFLLFFADTVFASTDPSFDQLIEQLISQSGYQNYTPEQIISAIQNKSISNLIPKLEIDVSNKINSAITSPLINTFSSVLDMRVLDGANTHGTQPGFGFGIAAGLLSPPKNFNDTLSVFSSGKATFDENGINLKSNGNASSQEIPVLPFAYIYLTKGLPHRIDVGVSFIPDIAIYTKNKNLKSISMYALQIKWNFYLPDEGMHMAFYLGYSSRTLGLSFDQVSLNIRSKSFFPALIISKPLHFFEPYMGVGLQLSSGNLFLKTQIYENILNVKATKQSQARYAHFFVGLKMPISSLGLNITIEGTYSPSGISGISSKIGLLLM